MYSYAHINVYEKNKIKAEDEMVELSSLTKHIDAHFCIPHANFVVAVFRLMRISKQKMSGMSMLLT